MKERFPVLDSIRGITLISMIFYHATWDLVYIWGVEMNWFESRAAFVWQQSICWCFILLSGFCLQLGSKKFKRGLTVFGGGLLITAVTLIVMPENRIVFGVLTLLGSAMLITALCECFLRKIPPVVGVVISFALFAFLYSVGNGFVGFFGWKLLNVPQELYGGYLSAFLGFPGYGFYSTDYFPLLPWFFLFVSGYYIFTIVQGRGWMRVFKAPRIPVLEWIGKKSLILYLLHQPIVYLVLSLLVR